MIHRTSARRAPIQLYTAAALRILLGGIMFAHGAQHLIGWFGGFGFSGTFGWMTETLGIPAVLAAPAIVLEFVTALMLIAGAGSRYAAGFVVVNMLVAASTHLPNGFFMNWIGNQGGEGFEYHLLAIGLALAVIERGSGAFALDTLLPTDK